MALPRVRPEPDQASESTDHEQHTEGHAVPDDPGIRVLERIVGEEVGDHRVAAEPEQEQDEHDHARRWSRPRLARRSRRACPEGLVLASAQSVTECEVRACAGACGTAADRPDASGERVERHPLLAERVDGFAGETDGRLTDDAGEIDARERSPRCRCCPTMSSMGIWSTMRAKSSCAITFSVTCCTIIGSTADASARLRACSRRATSFQFQSRSSIGRSARCTTTGRATTRAVLAVPDATPTTTDRTRRSVTSARPASAPGTRSSVDGGVSGDRRSLGWIRGEGRAHRAPGETERAEADVGAVAEHVARARRRRGNRLPPRHDGLPLRCHRGTVRERII